MGPIKRLICFMFIGMIKFYRYVMSPIKRLICFMFIGMIKFYRYVMSPMSPPCCRFQPTCSEYCLEAFKTHSLLKAIWLSLYRLLRCQPLSRAGYDPVPKKHR